MSFVEEIWFGYPFWIFYDLYDHNDDLLKYCLLRKFYDDGKQLSNVGGWQSSDIKHDEEIPKNFTYFLQQKINVLSDKFQKNILIDNWWININGFKTKNKEHIHPGFGNLFSGVYYVKSKKEQGNIVFKNPNFYTNTFIFHDLPKYSDYYPDEVNFLPETGKLIIFPSVIPHRVEYNNTNIERISIPFNTFIQTNNSIK